MRIIVTGSRKHPDRILVGGVLTGMYLEHGPFTLVHGACATGADFWAAEWFEPTGRMLGCHEIQYPARWEIGREAGPARNQLMVLGGADLMLGFPMGPSPGTRHTMWLARQAGIEVREITPRENPLAPYAPGWT